MLLKEAKGIIWDLDHTLIDVIKARRGTQLAFLGELGFTSDFIDAAIKVWNRMFWHFNPFDHTAILFALRAELDCYQLLTDEQIVQAPRYLTTEFLRRVEVVDGAYEILNMCQERGIRMGIVSNGEISFQWSKINKTGLSSYFSIPDAIIICDEHLGKPHPNPLFHCCSVLGLEPDSVVYIGDRVSDVVVAHLAGCMSVRLLMRAPEEMEPPLVNRLKIETPYIEIEKLQELSSLLFK